MRTEECTGGGRCDYGSSTLRSRCTHGCERAHARPAFSGRLLARGLARRKLDLRARSACERSRRGEIAPFASFMMACRTREQRRRGFQTVTSSEPDTLDNSYRISYSVRLFFGVLRRRGALWFIVGFERDSLAEMRVSPFVTDLKRVLFRIDVSSSTRVHFYFSGRSSGVQWFSWNFPYVTRTLTG